MVLFFSFLCNRYWHHEVQVANKELRKPSLSNAIIKCYWKSYAVLGIFTFIEVNVFGTVEQILGFLS